jgi:hypothetical protein
MDSLDSLLGMIVLLGGPVLYGWLQWRALEKARAGGRRMAALAPSLFLAAAAALTAAGNIAGQNLAPLVVVLSFPLALAWLALLGGRRGS